MNSGLVSVIVPVYNRPAMLGEAVASVLAQTYRPIEVIIIDDGSTDATAKAADDLASAHREVHAIHQKNGGPGAARETGRITAGGEFIQHLDSDDLLLPRKLEVQVAALRERENCEVAYGWTRLQSNGYVDPRPSKRTGEALETMFPAMLQSRWWDTPNPLYRRSLIDAAGAWTTLRIEEDWEYDCRVAALKPQLAFCADWVCVVRRHDEGHLSGRGGHPTILRDRARAHELILAHARRAGITSEAHEMKHFARELFLLARQCGAAGLTSESKRLFELARDASGTDGGKAQFRVYAVLARIVGWSAAGKLASLTDKLR